MKKALITVAVMAALALGGYVAHRAYLKVSEQSLDRGGRPVAAVPVEIAPVRKVTLREVGRFTGSLLPDSQFLVAPRTAGRLEKLLVDIGDRIERGQVIAVLDDQEYVQQVERAKAEMAVAKATVEECRSNLEVARREFERVETLRQKKVASESEYDQTKAQFQVHEARCQVAAAQVDQKKAALRETEIRFSYTKITAVWEGGAQTRVVGERYIDEGALLTANAPIVSILDIRTLKAVVYCSERYYAKITVGQEAAVTTDAFPGRVFAGQVARIAPQLKKTSRQARVEINVPNDEGLLKPGMFVRVDLEFAEHQDVAAVPVAALARRGDRRGVFVADAKAGTARFVPVELGITSGNLVEIVSPPLDGPVVVMGQHLLEDGSAITVAEEARPDAADDSGANRPPADDGATSRGSRP